MPLSPSKKTPTKKRLTPASTVVKPGKKVSKKSGPGEPSADCCSALVAGNTTGLVFSDGNGLQVLPFPAVNSTLQYINGSPTWVNNS